MATDTLTKPAFVRVQKSGGPAAWFASLCCLVGALLPIADQTAAAQSQIGPPPYQLLRYEETYGYLQDVTRRTDVWDPIKYIRLGHDADQYLSLGGELRERYEYFDHYNWGQGTQDPNGYLLQRYMAHADLHLGPQVRAFVQLKSGLEKSRDGGPRPPDDDDLDLNQAFVDVSADVTAPYAITVRTGRQEIAFGSQRLVSVREGPNVRQSFDGLRGTLTAGDWRIDAFGARPVQTKTGSFDDGPDYKRWFWGVYTSGPLSFLPVGWIDVYYLGLDRDQARFSQGTAHELRHSLGTRLWGRLDACDYNFEFLYQLGRFGGGNIAAWTAASDTGYTVSAAPLQPRLGVKVDAASGDRNPNAKTLQTFNALFPKGAYFNEADLIGPANFIDLHPSADFHVGDRATVSTDWDFYWRQSAADGIYGVAVNLVRPAGKSSASYIGSALSLKVDWRLDRHITFTTAYTHFFAGAFLKETPPGEDVNFLAGWATYKF
jgi:hypothetical protein